MVDKRKLKQLMAQEGKFKVYSEQDLIKPIGRLLEERTYQVPINGAYNKSSGQIIFKNLIEKYFLDFLGLDDSHSDIPKILNPRAGTMHKDYSQQLYSKMTIPYRSPRPVFEEYEDKSVGHKFFKDCPQTDFIYAAGDFSSWRGTETNMRVTPMEFFAKYIDTRDEKNDSEFMFVRYASAFGSMNSFRDPNELNSFGRRFDVPSLENNVHYSRIKYFEDDENPFVYVENRRLSIIKKRNLINLTVNKDYYNNLLTSLAYVFPTPRSFNTPLSTILRQFYDGKFWGTSYDLSFNSIKAFNRNPAIVDDIKEYDEEEYLVFDDLDFSYSKSGDSSKAYAITSEGMYTVSRKIDGTLLLTSPKGTMQSLNAANNLVESIGVATKPAFENYKNEGDGPTKIKRFKTFWVESAQRKEPINYLFSVLTNGGVVGSEESLKIKKTSIYSVLEKIYANKLHAEDAVYQKSKNSSKLALDPVKDQVQILADYLADSHQSVYSDFIKNSYKVTIGKLKSAFQFAPRALRATKEDYEKGLAINLGDEMYLKLIKYNPIEVLGLPYSMRWNHQGESRLNPNILKVNKTNSLADEIQVTLGWLLVTYYDLCKSEKDPNRSLTSVLSDVRTYLDDFETNGKFANNSYTSPRKTNSWIPFNYNGRNGMYVTNHHEFETSESREKAKNHEAVARLSGLVNGKSLYCEPIFEPTQYKVIAKDSAGNVAYSIIRPFVSVDINADGDNCTVDLTPSIPMHNFVFYAPKLKEDAASREVFSVYLYSSKNEELVDFNETFVDPLPRNLQEMDRESFSSSFGAYRDTLRKQDEVATKMLRNPFIVTLRDIFTGSLSSEKHPNLGYHGDMIAPYLSEAWKKLFQAKPSAFFADYKVPDILFGKVGEKYKKIKKGDDLKNYFKGSSWEMLRVDAWLGIRPADKSNLYLYNPEHWVNQREILDHEFLLYMMSVFAGGAYHLTTIVEAGMDTRELSFDTYDDRLHRGIFAPHHRGPYGLAILSQDSFSYSLSSTLAYFTGCFAAERTITSSNLAYKGFECFASTDQGYQSKNFRASSTKALMGIRDGRISTYADFVVESFEPSLIEKTKKEKKAIRNRLHKFILSEDYAKAVLMTASQPVIETIASGHNIGTDIMAPVENLEEEMRVIRRKNDFGTSDMIDLFREVFSFRIYTDDTLNYSLYEIFKYLKSLVVEQRAGLGIFDVATIYKNYLDNLYAVKKYGKIDLQNRKVAFPDALKTQADIARYNRELIKDREEMERFQKGSQQYKMMEYKNDKYIIRMAKSPLELQLEGNNLGHCVGTYVSSMTAGTNIIFFLRERGKADSSNVTVEFIPYTGSMSNSSTVADFNGENLEFTMRGHINQVQGMSRRPVNLDEALFLNEWRTFVQSQMRKKVNIIPSLGKKKKVKVRYEFSFGASIQNQIHNHFIDRPPVA